MPWHDVRTIICIFRFFTVSVSSVCGWTRIRRVEFTLPTELQKAICSKTRSRISGVPLTKIRRKYFFLISESTIPRISVRSHCGTVQIRSRSMPFSKNILSRKNTLITTLIRSVRLLSAISARRASDIFSSMKTRITNTAEAAIRSSLGIKPVTA